MSDREVESFDELTEDSPTLYWAIDVERLPSERYSLEIEGTAPHGATGEATDYTLTVRGDFDEKPSPADIAAHQSDIINKLRAANVLSDGDIQTLTIHRLVTDE